MPQTHRKSLFHRSQNSWGLLEEPYRYHQRLISIFLKAIIIPNISCKKINTLTLDNFDLPAFTPAMRKKLPNHFDENTKQKWYVFLEHVIPAPEKNDQNLMEKLVPPTQQELLDRKYPQDSFSSIKFPLGSSAFWTSQQLADNPSRNTPKEKEEPIPTPSPVPQGFTINSIINTENPDNSPSNPSIADHNDIPWVFRPKN